MLTWLNRGVAKSPTPTGPYRDDPEAKGDFFGDAISRPCTEGPTAVRAPDAGEPMKWKRAAGRVRDSPM